MKLLWVLLLVTLVAADDCDDDDCDGGGSFDFNDSFDTIGGDFGTGLDAGFTGFSGGGDIGAFSLSGSGGGGGGSSFVGLSSGNIGTGIGGIGGNFALTGLSDGVGSGGLGLTTLAGPSVGGFSLTGPSVVAGPSRIGSSVAAGVGAFSGIGRGVNFIGRRNRLFGRAGGSFLSGVNRGLGSSVFSGSFLGGSGRFLGGGKRFFSGVCAFGSGQLGIHGGSSCFGPSYYYPYYYPHYYPYRYPYYYPPLGISGNRGLRLGGGGGLFQRQFRSGLSLGYGIPRTRVVYVSVPDQSYFYKGYIRGYSDAFAKGFSRYYSAGVRAGLGASRRTASNRFLSSSIFSRGLGNYYRAGIGNRLGDRLGGTFRSGYNYLRPSYYRLSPVGGYRSGSTGGYYRNANAGYYGSNSGYYGSNSGYYGASSNTVNNYVSSSGLRRAGPNMPSYASQSQYGK